VPLSSTPLTLRPSACSCPVPCYAPPFTFFLPLYSLLYTFLLYLLLVPSLMCLFMPPPPPSLSSCPCSVPGEWLAPSLRLPGPHMCACVRVRVYYVCAYVCECMCVACPAYQESMCVRLCVCVAVAYPVYFCIHKPISVCK
jgi:hypothetical protein